MRRILFICFLILNFVSLSSQTIKIENGLSLSSMSSDKISILSDYLGAYSVNIGLNYLEHPLWYLSSEVGYVKKGGKENDVISGDAKLKFKESFDYLHLNTTFRLRYSFLKSCIYAGCGPKLDILTSGNKPSNTLLDGYKLKRFSLGLKPEIGFDRQLNSRCSIGLNASYLINFNCLAESPYNQLKNNTFLLMLSFGYRLN